MYELMVESTFDAAHALRNYEGPCENLHGHTWQVQVFLKGNKLNKIGMVLDFKTIKKWLKEVLQRFDHKNLNDLPEFKKVNPTSENVALAIYKKMNQKTKFLSKVVVWESPNTYASYWK